MPCSMHVWRSIPSARLHGTLPKDSMVIVAGEKSIIAFFDYENMFREALTLQVVCTLAGMRKMLLPAFREYVRKDQP